MVLKEVRLLAHAQYRWGKLGRALHDKGKGFVLWSVNFLAERIMKDVIAYKKKEGWINPEMEILHSIFVELEKYENKSDKRLTRLWRNLGDSLCTGLDEDSFYLLRFFMFLKLLFDRQQEFEGAMHRAFAYYDWIDIEEKLEEFKRVRELQKEPLPRDELMGYGSNVRR